MAVGTDSTVLSSSVSDPDLDWIRIQSGQWIRIRIRDPDPEDKNDPAKVEKIIKFHVLKSWMSFFAVLRIRIRDPVPF